MLRSTRSDKSEFTMSSQQTERLLVQTHNLCPSFYYCSVLSNHSVTCNLLSAAFLENPRWGHLMAAGFWLRDAGTCRQRAHVSAQQICTQSPTTGRSVVIRHIHCRCRHTHTHTHTHAGTFCFSTSNRYNPPAFWSSLSNPDMTKRPDSVHPSKSYSHLHAAAFWLEHSIEVQSRTHTGAF
jgi:hypothetical protein